MVLTGKKRILAEIALLVLDRHVIILLLAVAVVCMLALAVLILIVTVVVVAPALLCCRVHAKRCMSHQNTTPIMTNHSTGVAYVRDLGLNQGWSLTLIDTADLPNNV